MLSDWLNKLRFSNPWKYKAPLLISWSYAMIAVSDINPLNAIIHTILAYVTLFGIAALGYFINDWADIKSDKKAGKPNKLGEYSFIVKVFILLVLIVFSFVPWLYLPLDEYSFTLISTEILLFMLYSLPPFRLKVRGFWGILCDALYAYVVPSVLASYTFYLLGGLTYTMFFYFILFLVPWLLCIGIRGILLHQLQDYSNDVLSNTKTFTSIVGVHQVKKIIQVFLPIELGLILVLFSSLFPSFYFLLPGYILFFIIKYFTIKKYKSKFFFTNSREFSYKFYDDFYLDILPIVVLFHLIIIDWRYTLLLGLHIVLFRNIIKNLLRYKN